MLHVTNLGAVMNFAEVFENWTIVVVEMEIIVVELEIAAKPCVHFAVANRVRATAMVHLARCGMLRRQILPLVAGQL